MRVHIVTWNLNKEGSAYSQARKKLIDRIDTLRNTPDPNLETVRFVAFNGSAGDLYNYLHKYIDGDDSIFVAEMFSYPTSYSGWMSKSTWDWINATYSL